MKAIADLKRSWFPKGIQRELLNLGSRVFRRCTEKKLAATLGRLEIPPGACVCVHSMLSGLGYLVGGPETVLRALQRAVPGCTIMMPSFPFAGSAKEYLDLGEVFDPERTPSRSGLLTETLRMMPGALRSQHPTHPCVALGPRAAQLIEGSEQSSTPFGDDSSYGRFSALADAYLLLIHTNNTSLVHRVQEMVDMPNLFLEGLFAASSVAPQGAVRTYRVKLHTPVLPLYVAEQGDGPRREYLWYPDYTLLFPRYNYERVREKLSRHPSLWEKLRNRHETLLARGIYRVENLGDSEIMSVRVGPWLEEINRDIRASITNYRADYSLDHLAQLHRQGQLTK